MKLSCKVTVTDAALQHDGVEGGENLQSLQSFGNPSNAE